MIETNQELRKAESDGKNDIKGSCLCGQLRYTIKETTNIFQFCHCSRCRKFTGSAFASNLFVRIEDFQWDEENNDLIGYYPLPDAKHFATCFCKQCGSSMPWKNQSGTIIIVPTGTLDNDPGVRPVQSIFTASAACWYVSPQEIPSFEELPSKKKG